VVIETYSFFNFLQTKALKQLLFIYAKSQQSRSTHLTYVG